ncbi:MAG: hypothetical protein WBD53_20470, partial [Xanthobacteraceae bacterium]
MDLIHNRSTSPSPIEIRITARAERSTAPIVIAVFRQRPVFRQRQCCLRLIYLAGGAFAGGGLVVVTGLA